MSNVSPAYLNLDELASKVEVVVKLNGAEHKLKRATVQDFIDSTKLVEELEKAEKKDEQEFLLVLSMLLRFFPSMKEEDLKALTMQQLEVLLEFANKHSGNEVVTEEAAKDSAAKNP